MTATLTHDVFFGHTIGWPGISIPHNTCMSL